MMILLGNRVVLEDGRVLESADLITWEQVDMTIEEALAEHDRIKKENLEHARTLESRTDAAAVAFRKAREVYELAEESAEAARIALSIAETEAREAVKETK